MSNKNLIARSTNNVLTVSALKISFNGIDWGTFNSTPVNNNIILIVDFIISESQNS